MTTTNVLELLQTLNEELKSLVTENGNLKRRLHAITAAIDTSVSHNDGDFEAQEEFAASAKTIRRPQAARRVVKPKSPEGKGRPGRKPSMSEEDQAALIEAATKHPDRSYSDLAGEFKVSTFIVQNTLKKAGLLKRQARA